MCLSIEFQEAYKRLDRLCRDYLSSQEGVSEYIRQMDNTPWRDRCYVLSWETTYKQLKHIRWVRNQLAHEVGTLDSDICTMKDLEYVRSFYDSILNGTDPFTVIRKAKEQKNEEQRVRQKASREQTQREQTRREPTAGAENDQVSRKEPFIKRMIAKIKRWFQIAD